MVVSKSQQYTRRLSLCLPWVITLMASIMSFLSTDMSSRHFSSRPMSNWQVKYILYMPRRMDANLGVVLGRGGSLGCSALGVRGSFNNSCSYSRLGSCSMLPTVSLCAILYTSDASMPACILPLLLAKSREVGLLAFFSVFCECLSSSSSLWTTRGEFSCNCSIFQRLRKEYILQMAYSSCTLSLSGVSLFSNLSVSWMISATQEGDLSVCMAWWWVFPASVWVCWSM